MKKLSLKMDDIQETLSKEQMKNVFGGVGVRCYHNEYYCGTVECSDGYECAIACAALVQSSGC